MPRGEVPLRVLALQGLLSTPYRGRWPQGVWNVPLGRGGRAVGGGTISWRLSAVRPRGIGSVLSSFWGACRTELHVEHHVVSVCLCPYSASPTIKNVCGKDNPAVWPHFLFHPIVLWAGCLLLTASLPPEFFTWHLPDQREHSLGPKDLLGLTRTPPKAQAFRLPGTHWLRPTSHCPPASRVLIQPVSSPAGSCMARLQPCGLTTAPAGPSAPSRDMYQGFKWLPVFGV